MKRVLTGLQPSGGLHLGNFFGAVMPCLERQGKHDVDLLVFLADYHALTTVHDGKQLRGHTAMLAEDLLALGLEPSVTTVFRQSDVPAVTELALLLSMVTGMGLLQRAHSYKDKVSKGLTPNVGLFFYPVLMAADILLYRSDVVPVGRDQKQHVEMARDMAVRFNETFGPTFKLPEAAIADAPTVLGTDGQKMSKSYDNTISPFAEGDELRSRIALVKTSSVPFGEPLPTDGHPLYELLALVCPDEIGEIRSFFRTGRRGSRPFGYGHAKEILAEGIESRFAQARERRSQLKSDPERVDAVLHDGAARVTRVAAETLNACRQACGIG